MFSVFNVTFITFLITTISLFSIIQTSQAEFNLVKEIQTLQNQNLRDNALDLVFTFKDQNDANQNQLLSLEKQLSYSFKEKVKLIVWDGAVKGNVVCNYTGIDAMTSDMMLFGTVRDMVKHFWLNKIANKENNSTAISGIKMANINFSNGMSAFIKNTKKYLDHHSAIERTGLLKPLLSGNISQQDQKKVWDLLKKTDCPYPEPCPACPASRIPVNSHLQYI